ncbi:MAG: hypothetical protein WC812_02510 [Candidatus Pacearchaeota archaeon]|jgi:hypothetical protein
MVYKELIKFDNKKDYEKAREYLRALIKNTEGSCVFDDERDHYESVNKEMKINLDNKKFAISAECKYLDDQSFLEKKLNEFKKTK